MKSLKLDIETTNNIFKLVNNEKILSKKEVSHIINSIKIIFPELSHLTLRFSGFKNFSFLNKCINMYITSQELININYRFSLYIDGTCKYFSINNDK